MAPRNTIHIPPGAAKILLEAQDVCAEAVEADDEEELESYQSALEVDDAEDEACEEEAHGKARKAARLDSDAIHQTVKLASQEVVTPRTLSEYQRHFRSFMKFLIAQGWLDEGDTLSAESLPKQLPEYICMWIMDKCDDIDIHTNRTKGCNDPEPASYGHAQKLRAAMTHHFGRELGLGTQSWQPNPAIPGAYSGNPSLSTTVGQYMVSLRRKKNKRGETVTSARAIDETTLKSLWRNNLSTPEVDGNRKKRGEKDPTLWTGRNIRVMLWLLYIISFLCLLRYDEALHIMWSDVILTEVRTGVYRLELRLAFRKTHQYGGIAPFYLYSNKERPWLCPIRAYAEWVAIMKKLGLRLEGYIFRPRVGLDSISSNCGIAMSGPAFLECFRNNLLDIGVDPRPYGTHSLRRGGCQWLAVVARWSYRRICEWGGWAANFDNPGTSFKYLLSWNDDPMERRENFFNPDQPQSDSCTHCGRSCSCAF